MDVLAIFNKRNNRMTSIEDKSIIPDGSEVFLSAYSTDENRFHIHDVSCSAPNVFEVVKPLIGTRQTPVLIQAGGENVPNLVNVYVENGSLKIAAS